MSGNKCVYIIIYRLPKLVFEVSKKMLIEYSRNSVVATVEREAGWLLLASLLASLPKEVIVYIFPLSVLPLSYPFLSV